MKEAAGPVNCDRWGLIESMAAEGTTRKAIRRLLVEDGMSEDEADRQLDRFEKGRRSVVRFDAISSMLILSVGLILTVGTLFMKGSPVWIIAYGAVIVGVIRTAITTGEYRRFRRFRKNR